MDKAEFCKMCFEFLQFSRLCARKNKSDKDYLVILKNMNYLSRKYPGKLAADILAAIYNNSMED